jgi:hypothetical protein
VYNLVEYFPKNGKILKYNNQLFYLLSFHKRIFFPHFLNQVRQIEFSEKIRNQFPPVNGLIKNENKIVKLWVSFLGKQIQIHHHSITIN